MIQFKFKREMYPKVALLKASYNFTDKAFIHLDADDQYFYVEVEMKDSSEELSEKEFLNEMLAQSVRHEIYRQTKNIRELMLARAMASTIVTDTGVENLNCDAEENYSEKEILRDWFSGNEDTEAKN